MVGTFLRHSVEQQLICMYILMFLQRIFIACSVNRWFCNVIAKLRFCRGMIYSLFTFSFSFRQTLLHRSINFVSVSCQFSTLRIANNVFVNADNSDSLLIAIRLEIWLKAELHISDRCRIGLAYHGQMARQTRAEHLCSVHYVQRASLPCLISISIIIVIIGLS